eukprot:6172711-Pleurochrysis_carterae.AAC.2
MRVWQLAAQVHCERIGVFKDLSVESNGLSFHHLSHIWRCSAFRATRCARAPRARRKREEIVPRRFNVLCDAVYDDGLAERHRVLELCTEARVSEGGDAVQILRELALQPEQSLRLSVDEQWTALLRAHHDQRTHLGQAVVGHPVLRHHAALRAGCRVTQEVDSVELWRGRQTRRSAVRHETGNEAGLAVGGAEGPGIVDHCASDSDVGTEARELRLDVRAAHEPLLLVAHEAAHQLVGHLDALERRVGVGMDARLACHRVLELRRHGVELRLAALKLLLRVAHPCVGGAPLALGLRLKLQLALHALERIRVGQHRACPRGEAGESAARLSDLSHLDRLRVKRVQQLGVLVRQPVLIKVKQLRDKIALLRSLNNLLPRGNQQMNSLDEHRGCFANGHPAQDEHALEQSGEHHAHLARRDQADRGGRVVEQRHHRAEGLVDRHLELPQLHALIRYGIRPSAHHLALLLHQAGASRDAVEQLRGALLGLVQLGLLALQLRAHRVDVMRGHLEVAQRVGEVGACALQAAPFVAEDRLHVLQVRAKERRREVDVAAVHVQVVARCGDGTRVHAGARRGERGEQRLDDLAHADS